MKGPDPALAPATESPLIAHVVFRFDIGGLENGLVNLLNRLPKHSYRHAIISLTEVADFRRRVVRDDVLFYALNKGPGYGARLYPKLTRLFKRLSPAIVHTRNLAALEATIPAWYAGVPVRIHGEHGWDSFDVNGSSRKYQLVRRLYRPFVTHYVALSNDLRRYLVERIGVAPVRVSQIYNGVDTSRFEPLNGVRTTIQGCPFTDPSFWLIGTVGRIQEIKDQLTLAKAFISAVRRHPSGAKLRLVVVGEGPLRSDLEGVLDAAGLRHAAWFAGERNDVDAILRGFDCFVLPSLGEGISNTILEAMATGLAVIATRVGGNSELVQHGMTGCLVPAADCEEMAGAILAYFNDAALARRHGIAARQSVTQTFSLDRMVQEYATLYGGLLERDAQARRDVRRPDPVTKAE